VTTTLTLDLGLDFKRVLPGERHGTAAAAVAAAPAPPVHTASAPQRGPTLDDLVAGVWEGLRCAQPVACPICDGVVEPRYGSGPAPVGGRCRSCASTIA
jgi:hypothetical protein